ncbi:MAG: RHS repeat-associated core domain-containing protein [Thermoanaerobaculia bacterium]
MGRVFQQPPRGRRRFAGKPFREFGTIPWAINEDTIYRDGQLLAGGQTNTHFHLDHLGTPRLVTNGADAKVAYHVYLPFGEEMTAINQDTTRLKFTGHERDLGNTSTSADDLDYMHARFHSPLTGRFLSTDRVIALGSAMKGPQSWNRYAYAMGNPLRYTDPSGELPRSALAEIFSRYFGDGSGASLNRQFYNFVLSHSIGWQGPSSRSYPSDFVGPLQPGDSRGPFSTRDIHRLGTLDDNFRAALESVFSNLQTQGWDPGIPETGGVRSLAEQQEKVRLGLSRTMNSQHLFGKAADVVNRSTGYSLGHGDPFAQSLRQAAAAQGLVWGGDWKSFPDPFHIELP